MNKLLMVKPGAAEISGLFLQTFEDFRCATLNEVETHLTMSLLYNKSSTDEIIKTTEQGGTVSLHV